MSCTPRRITILGSTGSIGTSALDVVRHYPERFEVVGLAANANIELLAQQVREFRPKYVAVANRDAARKLSEQMPGISIAAGCEGLEEIAAAPADVVLCGIVGAVGLKPVLSAIEAGNAIALANKEPLVMAGRSSWTARAPRASQCFR